MVSIVLQLQQDVQDPTKKVADLLRRAKVIAVKLNLTDFGQWIESELNGYKVLSDIPKYRLMQGQPKLLNPYRGWVPIKFKDVDNWDAFAHWSASQSIAELEHVVENTDPENGLQMPYPEYIQIQLRELYNGQFTDFSLMITHTSVWGVIEAVRNILLDWSLKLEKEGIVGHDVSFSEEEKKIAMNEKVINYHINVNGNFNGTMGEINDQATVTVNTQLNENDLSEINKILLQLTDAVKVLKLGEEKEVLLAQEIKSVQSLVGEQPNEKGLIKNRLSMIKNMLLDAGGNIIAEGFITALSNFL